MDTDENAVKVVDEFLSRFLINSESSGLMDNIDLRLMLTALNQVVHRNNIDQINLYQFHTLQAAIIAFSNENIVTAFDFFDGKNQKRTSDVRELIMDQKKNLDNVDKIMNNVKNQVNGNYRKMEDLLRMHE